MYEGLVIHDWLEFVMVFCVLFFFKQKTAYEMRISDWSSDVCSSDLNPASTGALAKTSRAMIAFYMPVWNMSVAISTPTPLKAFSRYSNVGCAASTIIAASSICTAIWRSLFSVTLTDGPAVLTVLTAALHSADGGGGKKCVKQSS